jgi:restriction system protein
LVTDQNSPQERIESALNELNEELAGDLMTEIMKMTPYEFERLVVKLLIKMGYGKPEENKDAVTAKSGDEGIDGIVSSDKFGFDSIYIQAKQWKNDSTVGRPEIQKFLGALAGQGATKGIFITTAKFSKEAEAFAAKQLHSKIVLVDGERLTKLMIEFDLGVSTVHAYLVKRIDSDFFSDDV